ncbi:MAG: Ldh family oxidoreductase [Pseudorhodobacter sp.]|nr:Ldh family oxidoreductase [Pseudorhodobacter sp.]
MTHIDIPLDAIEATTTAALIGHGADPAVAGQVAKAVRAAEASGNVICGLYYLESYCQQLRSGRVQGGAVARADRVRPGAVQVDAGFGFAQAAFAAGLPLALAAVAECGTATLAIAHAHTCTSLGYFTRQIAEAGYIGLGFTNATPVVAPPGGKIRMIGTNPIAFSVPDGQGGLALHMDQSTSAVALGKITQARAAGQSIPLGWAVDAEGKPTTDPEAALAGALVSSGGHKGWGFGLMAEVMAAVLTGSTLSRDVAPLKTPTGRPHDLGQTYLLIDPQAFAGDAAYAALARLAETVALDEGARLPGVPRRHADPVSLDAALWAQVQALAQR